MLEIWPGGDLGGRQTLGQMQIANESDVMDVSAFRY